MMHASTTQQSVDKLKCKQHQTMKNSNSACVEDCYYFPFPSAHILQVHILHRESAEPPAQLLTLCLFPQSRPAGRLAVALLATLALELPLILKETE